MADSYYTPDGDLAVWTGAAYHIIPRVAQGDVGTVGGEVTERPWWSGDQDGSGWNASGPSYTGILDPGKYGLPQDPNNFMRLANNNSGELDYLLKSADKEGTQIRYVLKDGQYVPQLMGTQGWDTNADSSGAVGLNVAKVLAAPFAVNALQGAGLLGGGGSTLGGGAGFEGAALGGLGGVEPISYSGFTGATGGIGSLGSGWGSAGVVAGEGGAATLGGSLGGSAGTDFLGKAGDFLKNNPSALSSLGKLGGLLAGGALGTQGQTGGGQTAIAQPVPTMYGGAAPNAPSWGPMGNTETERRMRKDYYPGLLGGLNPWGY